VAAVAGLVVAVSTLPYAAGYLAQTADLRFSGALLDRVDYYSYLARMWEGYRGAWRFEILFTPEAHQGAYFQPFHLALGHLARLTRLDMQVVYQIARVTLALAMLLTIYRFIAQFIGRVRTRRVAFLLAVTASGLGWLTEVIAPTPPNGVSPMDFWLLDGFTYLAVLAVPHFCAAISLLLGILIVLLRRLEGPSRGEAAAAAVASVLLGLIHPYTLLLADLLPLLYWGAQALRARPVLPAPGAPWPDRQDRQAQVAVRPGRAAERRGVSAARRRMLALAAMAAAQIPLLAYEVWAIRSEPVFAAWSAQNITLSPPPRIYLLGYGALLALAAAGVITWLRRGASGSQPPEGGTGDRMGLAFPLLWIGVAAVTAYLPWNLQRRFLEGVQVPLGLLAGVGLAEGIVPWPDGHLCLPVLAVRPGRPRCRQDRPWPGKGKHIRLRRVALPMAVALMAMSNLYLTAGFTVAAAGRSPALFWPADLLAGVDWLGENTGAEDTVLAAFDTGNLIPARIGHRVVMGHWIETADFEGKRAEVARFFEAATPDGERQALLERYGVAYVFYGPYERALGAFDPATAGYLTLAAQLPSASIYRVNRP